MSPEKLNAAEVGRLISAGETIKVEFKGEARRSLLDREVYENGGEAWSLLR